MPDNIQHILVIGIGVYGRGDDQVGHYFVEQLQKMINENKLNDIPYHLTLQHLLHLNIEDVQLISNFEYVFIVDASVDSSTNSYSIKVVEDSFHTNFTTHIIQPCQIKQWVLAFYGKLPNIYEIRIQGYQFNLTDKISTQASKNLTKALQAFIQMLKQKRLGINIHA